MSPIRNLTMDIIYNLIWLAFIYGIFAAPTVMIFSMRVDVLLAASTALFIYFFVIRRVIKHVIPMILAHIIALITVWQLAPSLLYLVIYGGMAVVIAVFSLCQRYRRARRSSYDFDSPRNLYQNQPKCRTFSSEFTLFAPIAFVALALAAAHQGYAALSTQYAALIIITHVGSKLHIRSAHVNDSLDVITQSSNQPVKKILAFDYKIVFVLCLALVGVILMLNTFLIRPALVFVSGLRPNIRLNDSTPHTISDYVHEPTIPQDPRQMPLDNHHHGETALFWQLLEWVFLFIVIPLAILAVIAMLIRTIYIICMKLRLRKNPNQSPADNFEDIKEFIRTPKAKRTRHKRPQNEHSTRRLFRETVSGHINKGVPINKSDTPVQMSGKIQGEDISALAEEYTVVRYGHTDSN